MRRRGVWMGVVAAIAALALLSPPAVAAEQIGPPFLTTDGELACAAAAGFYGPPYGGVPRPPNAAPTRSPVICTSKHAVQKGGLVTASLTARGAGMATEGSFSSLFSYGYLRHRIKSVKSMHYEVTVVIEDAFADVAVQHQPTTTSYIALVFGATHSTCRACSATSVEIIADTNPMTDTPDRVKAQTVTVGVDIDTGNSGSMPSGNVGLVFAAMPMVMTGTYASPVEALGSGTVRVRTTRITADAS